MQDARIRKIAETLPPLAGWRVVESRHRSRSGSGVCEAHGRVIRIPELTTKHALYVLLHERAHAALHCGRDLPRSVEEYEAEWAAIRGMRALGFSVPRSEIADAKDNVNKCVLREIKNGFTVPRHIRRWSKPGK